MTRWKKCQQQQGVVAVTAVLGDRVKKKMEEHILEFLEAVDEISAHFGLIITMDPRGDTLMLAKYDDPEVPVVWLNTETLRYGKTVAAIDEHRLAAIVGADSAQVEDFVEVEEDGEYEE
jgi:hypothetical protein